MKATYNITNDKIKFYPEEYGRLPAEEYEKARKCRFTFWHGSKCFAAKWSPQAEDFVKSYGITIEEDDTPDDVEARSERYGKYAERSEQNAEYAADRVATANTARRLRLAEGTLTSETEKAAYWHDRAAGAIAHARYKDRPDVIVRRILGLEKELRDQQKYFNTKGEYEDEGTVYVYVSNGGRGSSLVKKDSLTKIQAHAQRWIDHIEARLEYERTYLEAVGGDPRKEVEDIGIGDIVEYAGEEWEVASAGSRNVILYNKNRPDYLRRRQVGRENVGKIIRKAETPQKRKVRKAVAPEDGITKGAPVTWRTWTDRGLEYFTTKCVSASPRTIRVEFPEDPRFNRLRERGDKGYKVDRRYAKPAGKVADE
jgi:hypothetical protein